MNTMTAREVMGMLSGDYSGFYDSRDMVRMSDVLDYMERAWVDYPEMAHPGESEHDGPSNYVEALADTMAESGWVGKPLVIRRGYVIDGHHRSVAAALLDENFLIPVVDNSRDLY